MKMNWIKTAVVTQSLILVFLFVYGEYRFSLWSGAPQYRFTGIDVGLVCAVLILVNSFWLQLRPIMWAGIIFYSAWLGILIHASWTAGVPKIPVMLFQILCAMNVVAVACAVHQSKNKPLIMWIIKNKQPLQKGEQSCDFQRS